MVDPPSSISQKLPRIRQRLALFIHGPSSAFSLLNHNPFRSFLPPKTVVPFGVDLASALHLFSRPHFFRFLRPLSTFSQVLPPPSVRSTSPPPSPSSAPTTPSSKNGCTIWSRLGSTHSLSPLCLASSAPSVLVDLSKNHSGSFPSSARSTPRCFQVRTLSLSTADTRLGWDRTG